MAEDKAEVKAEDQLICCEECGMWAEFLNSGIKGVTFDEASKETFVFICQKCNKIKELEGLLAASANSNDWITVRSRGGKNSTGSVGKPSIEVSNSFVGLPVSEAIEEPEREIRGTESGISEGLWEGEKAKGKVLFVGDSITRYTDREFCKGDKRNRVRVCLPGARIEDVSARVNSVVGDEEVVAVQVGTNNLSRDSQVLLRSKFKELLCKLKSTRTKGVICGILPRFDRKGYWGKIQSLNKWLRNECTLGGHLFVDTWATFVNRGDLFCKDGLHLSGAGANELGRMVRRAVDSQLSN